MTYTEESLKGNTLIVMKPDKRSDSYQWVKFLEHWGQFLFVLVAFLVAQIFNFFMGLHGTPWMGFMAGSFVLMLSGGTLIGVAKFPLYRSGQFLTWGTGPIPQPLQMYYRWGWRLFLSGTVIGLGLLLHRP